MKHPILLFILSVAIFACKKDGPKIDDSYQPDVSPAKFADPTNLANPYLPFEPGKVYVYEKTTPDGLEHVEVRRLPGTKSVLGITCVVVLDQVWLNNVLIEETYDWFAQDNDGNVWYFGEAVDNFNPDGTFADHDGAWEAGVDGARPGIIMLADPQPGLEYREEYYFQEAEDEAEVLALGLTVKTAFGTFANCLQTRNFTRLAPGVEEHKFYAPGIGPVKEVDLENGEALLLIDIQE